MKRQPLFLTLRQTSSYRMNSSPRQKTCLNVQAWAHQIGEALTKNQHWPWVGLKGFGLGKGTTLVARVFRPPSTLASYSFDGHR